MANDEGMMHTLRLFSPAKINLFLHITAQRLDGYHDLQSVFRALDFGDWLAFRLYDDMGSAGLGGGDMGNGIPPISLTGASHLTKNLDDNLIIKAAHALAKHSPKQVQGVHIHLDKHIPTGAGLGGGSSNCATTLIALNQLWGLNLDTQALIDIAATLGADVPFFIFAHAHQCDAVATGIGEILTPIHLPKRAYLLLMPDAHLATAHFFKHPNLNKKSLFINDLSSYATWFDLTLTPPFHNCFETIASQDSPAVKDALAYLHALPCHATPRMTGTGSCVFLPLEAGVLDQAAAWRDAAPCRAVICHSLHGL